MEDKKEEASLVHPTVSKIYRDILEIYPFLSEDEKQQFKSKSEIFLHNPNPLPALEGILNLLQNGHAKIDPINPDQPKVPSEEKLDKIRPTYSIEDNILYIKIPSWNKYLVGIDKELIDICTNHWDGYQAIVIDVRENGGGNSSLAYGFAGIFFKEDIEFGKLVRKTEEGGLKENPYVMPANEDVYIDKPIAILISEKCFSSNELFLAPFKVTRRATLIGTRTSGGSGAPIFQDIELEGKKYQVSIPTYRMFLKGEAKPIEETAIEPDIPYQGMDIIGFAKAYLKNKAISE